MRGPDLAGGVPPPALFQESQNFENFRNFDVRWHRIDHHNIEKFIQVLENFASYDVWVANMSHHQAMMTSSSHDDDNIMTWNIKFSCAWCIVETSTHTFYSVWSTSEPPGPFRSCCKIKYEEFYCTFGIRMDRHTRQEAHWGLPTSRLQKISQLCSV